MVKPPCVNTKISLEKQIDNIFKDIEQHQKMSDIQLNRIDQLKKLIKVSLKQNYDNEQENSDEDSGNDRKHVVHLSEDDDSDDHDVGARRYSRRLRRKKN